LHRYKVENIQRSRIDISLVKLYTVLSNDTGHIYIVVVLQSCTDSLHILSSLSSETFPSSDCTRGVFYLVRAVKVTLFLSMKTVLDYLTLCRP
jgi:hypothetical protein